MLGTFAALALAATVLVPTPPSVLAVVPADPPAPAIVQNVNVPESSAPRGAALTSLYISFAALQALDFHSTTRAIENGGVEANPAMRSVAGNPAAFLAVKAATGATTIWIAEKLRKKHPKGAVVLMTVLNSAMATIVAHNYSVR